MVAVLTAEMGRAELQAALRLTHRPHFLASYLRPALEAGLVEMTLPTNQPARTNAIGAPLPAKPSRTKPRRSRPRAAPPNADSVASVRNA